MPKLPDTRVPAYCRHRASGQAVVTLDRQDIYLGKYGSASSKTKYNQLVAEWLAGGRRLRADPDLVTVGEIVAAHHRHAQKYYRLLDGAHSSEPENYVQAMRPLLKLYKSLPAIELSPLKLKAVQNEMVNFGWCRSNINKQTSRVRAVFKWAAENELIPPSVFHGLQTVGGLRVGRSDAKESAPVKPVPMENVDAILPYVSDQVAAMIRLQLMTGMRPGEVVRMRTSEIDTSGELWVYCPQHHKTVHHGHDRSVYLGPKARKIVEQFLKPDLAAYIFSPSDAEADRHRSMRNARQTPVQPSQVKRAEESRRRRGLRAPGNHYDVATYRRAIARACDKADTWAKGGLIIANDERIVPRWHPHRLRHTAATELRKTHGLEAAQVILGHKTLTVTQVYAERNVQQAMKIMGEVG